VLKYTAPACVALGSFYRDLVKSNALDGGPDDSETTHFGSEHVNLVSALTHVAKQAFDGVGGADMPVHRLWKVVKSERLVFFLAQTAHRLRIACAILGFEGGQLDEGSLLGGLGPDA
jgi:hypothetical protein